MYTSSIIVDEVIDALADFLTPLVDGATIARAQTNRVAMPPSPCVILTELLEVDLAIPYENYQPNDNTTMIHGATRIDIQVDFYGVQSGDFCKAAKAAFRSQWGFAQFPANIKPLYTSDGLQSPLITGEKQYESRWTVTVSIQYNPIVTVPQEFADEAIPNAVIPTDV